MVFDDQDHLMLPFYDLYCIRALNVTTGHLNDYAGHCGTKYQQYSGHRLNEMRMRSSTSIAHDSVSRLFFTDHHSSKIIILEDDYVSAVITIPYKPRLLKFDSITNGLYLSVNHGFGHIELSSHRFALRAGAAEAALSSNQTILLKDARFHYPQNFLQVETNQWLVTDVVNDRSVSGVLPGIKQLVNSQTNPGYCLASRHTNVLKKCSQVRLTGSKALTFDLLIISQASVQSCRDFRRHSICFTVE